MYCDHVLPFFSLQILLSLPKTSPPKIPTHEENFHFEVFKYSFRNFTTFSKNHHSFTR